MSLFFLFWLFLQRRNLYPPIAMTLPALLTLTRKVREGAKMEKIQEIFLNIKNKNNQSQVKKLLPQKSTIFHKKTQLNRNLECLKKNQIQVHRTFRLITSMVTISCQPTTDTTMRPSAMQPWEFPSLGTSTTTPRWNQRISRPLTTRLTSYSNPTM